MTYKLLLAATLSLGLGTGIAFAQSDTTTTDSTLGAAPDSTVSSQLPAGWDDAIGDAFFSDREAGTLRSEDEVRANFNTLTEEQQARIRSHCDTYDTAAMDTGADSAGDSSATDDLTTGSTTMGDSMNTASIEQICGWIDSM